MEIRSCFVPRDGWVFAQADYDQLELRTLAQVCLVLLGESELAKVLNAGEDPHTAFAAEMLGISYREGCRLKDSKDPEFDKVRGAAKSANFGLPGGIGVPRFQSMAKKSYGVVLTLEQCADLKKSWFRRWPEMRKYFDYISSCQNPNTGLYDIRHVFTGRELGGATYTAACNALFQGLGADCAKNAGWLLQKACYVERSSPLFGSRPVNFIHDEYIVETPDCDNAHDAAHELARLMIEGANAFLPDVPATTEPILMRRWSKKAVAVTQRGRLVPWSCEKCDGICLTKHCPFQDHAVANRGPQKVDEKTKHYWEAIKKIAAKYSREWREAA